MKELMPWYHSADDIASTLRALATQCKNADIDVSTRTQINVGSAAGAEVNMDVVRVSRSGGAPKLKAILVYGEHAREVISPESALNFVQTLCGQGPEAERASAVLDNVSFTIVPNANPLSRQKVEDGYYCQRTNEDGVDLNRNFGDAHRTSGEELGDERNPGPSGFSEPESKILKGIIDEERPDIYVSVHSGAYLLGTPFGFKRGNSPPTESSMMEVLGPISDKYCKGQCPYGNLAELINYDNPGCDIDYVAETGTPYVFTWEIYVGSGYRDRYIEEAQMRRNVGAGTPADDGLSLVQLKSSAAKRQRRARALQAKRAAAVLRGREPEAEQHVQDCLDQFNPQSEEETKDVLQRFTSAYLELAERVVKKQAAKNAETKLDSAATKVDSSSLM